MKCVIVRYKVKTERADENVEFVRNVFAELADSAPAGLRYATFRADDGVSFTHIAEIDTPGESNPLAATTVELVGSYRFVS